MSQKEKDRVVCDLANEGKPVRDGKTREKMISRTELDDLVAKDMTMAGKAFNDKAASDMVKTGHATEFNKELPHVTHQQRETESFMHTRKAGQGIAKQFVPEKAREEEETKVEEPAEEKSHTPLVFHILKKVVMPWRAWKDL